MEIKVVDAIMGAGKTAAAINYMRWYADRRRFLYVTPYLDEAERIKKECPWCCFAVPKSIERAKRTKSEQLRELLENGRNISTTHALFLRMEPDIRALIREQGYILIMDEECEVISRTSEKEKTSSTLSLPGPEEGQVFYYEVVPTDFFTCFQEVYVLTYRFGGSLMKAYFDYYGIGYRYLGISRSDSFPEYWFDERGPRTEKCNAKELIHIWNDKKANQPGGFYGSLSYSWYERHGAKSKAIGYLKNSLIRFFKVECKTKSAQNLWTTYNSSQKKLSSSTGGYTRGFEPHNIRATNRRCECTAVAYLINKYLSPEIKWFFQQRDITVDPDEYALTSMLQFVWRSAIREGKEINLYIPSARMRKLLTDWIKEVSE